MKIRLAKKIWKASERSLFSHPKDYWANRWSNTQFYESAIYDHRIVEAEKIMIKLIIKENKNINNGNNSQMP